MKKILNIVLCLLLFTLVGCSSLEDSLGDTSNEKIKVTYVTDFYFEEDEIVVIEKESKKVNSGLLKEPSDPEKDGYTFAGWATYNSKKQKFTLWDFEEDEADEDMTLYAQWTEGNNKTEVPTKGETEDEKTVVSKIRVTYVTEYFVEYDEIIIADSDYEKVTPGLLEEPEVPTRQGYKFLYWAYYDEDRGIFVEWDFNKDEATENIKLYAQWVVGYRVRFIVDGKVYSSAVVEANETVTPPKNPTLDNYEFKGWYLDGKIFDFETEITQDITLIAKFRGYGSQTYKLGMGIVAATQSYSETAQIDATVASVVLDDNGRIVMCRIDSISHRIQVSSLGEITFPATFKTKVELQDDYGMSKWGTDWNADGIILEWYLQAQAFEKHVVGKTAEEVMNMPTQTISNGYIISAEEGLLSAGCTIQIAEIKEAVIKACQDEQGMTFDAVEGEFTLGVAAVSYDDGSSAVGDHGEIRVYTDFAATVIENGKIVAALNDSIQPRFTVSQTGELTPSYRATKRELKEDYGMAVYGTSMDSNYDGIVLEWYLQSAAFSNHVIGMTAKEVAVMETAENNLGYQMSTDEDLLAAGCTIQITGLKQVVAKAADNAR